MCVGLLRIIPFLLAGCATAPPPQTPIRFQSESNQIPRAAGFQLLSTSDTPRIYARFPAGLDFISYDMLQSNVPTWMVSSNYGLLAVRLEWDSIPGRKYRVLWHGDMGTNFPTTNPSSFYRDGWVGYQFLTVMTTTVAPGSIMVFEHGAPPASGFYKVILLP